MGGDYREGELVWSCLEKRRDGVMLNNRAIDCVP